MKPMVWFILLIVFLVAEGATVAMVSAWFALGALAAMIVSLLGGPLWLQIVLFLAVSVVSLALLRPFAQKHFNNKVAKTNVDSVIGKCGYVTEEIDNELAKGQVKLYAMTWTARSSTDEKIAEGVLVQVDRVEGVKVYVTPKNT